MTSKSGKFPKLVKDNFLSEVLSEPTRKYASLDLFVNKERLLGDVMVGGSLGCDDHQKVEFKVLGVMRKIFSRVATLDFEKANFKLLRE